MEVSQEELRLFIGEEKADYYLNSWNKDFSMNWAGLLANIFWMAYRKMYLYLLALYVAVVILDIILDMLGLMTVYIDQGLGPIVIGLFGNKVYNYYARKKIVKIKNQYQDEEMQKAMIQKAGGTSWLGVIVLVIIICILIWLTIMFA